MKYIKKWTLCCIQLHVSASLILYSYYWSILNLHVVKNPSTGLLVLWSIFVQRYQQSFVLFLNTFISNQKEPSIYKWTYIDWSISMFADSGHERAIASIGVALDIISAHSASGLYLSAYSLRGVFVRRFSHRYIETYSLMSIRNS